MTTIADIKAAITAIRDSYEARILEITEENQMPPVVDASRRKHAPRDGYVWIDGNVYLGGQFLPEDEDYTGTGCVFKIKVLASLVPELNKFLAGAIGKTWEDNGDTVGYYYANVSKAEHRVMSKLLPFQTRVVTLADDNTRTATWVFKTSKFTRKFAMMYGNYWHEVFENMAWEFAPGVKFEQVIKKGKITFISDFDGKEVCYQYPDDVIRE